MKPFAHHFREHVVPRLRTEVQRAAGLLALGAIGWEEAEGQVLGVATGYGAAQLRGNGYAELIDWIDSKLLDEQIAAEIRSDAAMKALARREASDPVGYYSRLVAGSRNPSTMRWVFAAISPPYRKHLLAEVRCHA